MIVPTETPRLGSDGVTLREFRPEDAEARRACGTDPEILRMFGASPDFDEPIEMTADQARGWYEAVTEDPNPLHWAIEVEGRCVGTARLHRLDEVDRRARYAIGIFDANWLGRGLGQTVTKLVLEFGFDQLALHRIDLRVFAFNQRAIRCYLRCGFQEEGREREVALVDGGWQDDVIMGILADEFARTPGRE